MACLLNNFDKLDFDCNTKKCHIEGTRYGYNYHEDDEIIPHSGLPTCVQFIVSLKIDDQVLYETIGKWLEEYRDDEIKVNPMTNYRIKAEFTDAYEFCFNTRIDRRN
jgi:hypothetical protein